MNDEIFAMCVFFSCHNEIYESAIEICCHTYQNIQEIKTLFQSNLCDV